jgi:CDP-paratose synthetase
MKILITGGTGFLGRKTLKNLLSNPVVKIHLLYRSNSNLGFLSQEELNRIITIDYKREDNLEKTLSENSIDTVLHMATNYGRSGTTISDVLEANLALPLKLLTAGKNTGITHFLNIDSFYTKPQHNYKQLFNYTQSKRALLPWLEYFSTDFQVSNLILEHMYGPSDRDEKFIPSVIRCARGNWAENVVQSGGEQIRDFVYIDDVVSAIEAVLNRPLELNSNYLDFQVGTGTGTSLIEMISVVSQLLNCTTSCTFKKNEYARDEIMNSVANNSSLILLGWRPAFDLRTGLHSTIFGGTPL